MNTTEICNMALIRVGEQTILSLTEDSKNAKLCNLIFDPVFEQVLRATNWSCCTYRASLAENAIPPAFGYSNRFDLPTDPKCVRVLRLENPLDVFRVEGRYVMTNSGTCNIVYIGKSEDISVLDSLFIKVLYLSIAIEFGYTLVENNTIVNGLMQMKNEALDEARQMGSHEGTAEFIQTSSWLASRNAGLGYNINETNVY